jgi:hypothetical protein
MGASVIQQAMRAGLLDELVISLVPVLGNACGCSGVSLRPVEVNGGPGALFLDGQQRLIGVLALDISGGQITSISAIVNPDKLTHLGPLADFRSVLRSAR